MAIEIIQCESRETWLEERRKSIGASEVATILRLNDYDTIDKLYMRKIGQLPEVESNLAMRAGTFFESFIADEYAATTGCALEYKPFTIWRDSDFPWLHGSLDRVIVYSQDREIDGILQIKCVGSKSAHRWAERIPLEVECQVQCEMAASGLHWGAVAALIDTSELFHRDVERNGRFIDYVREQTKEFWDCVQRRQRP